MKKYQINTETFMNIAPQFPADRYVFFVLSELSPEKLKNRLEDLGEIFYNLENTYNYIFKSMGSRDSLRSCQEAMSIIKKEMEEIKIVGVNMRSIRKIHSISEVKEDLPVIY